MHWFEKLATSRKPDFVVGNDYLRRWWIIPRNNFFNAYLHQFLRSDEDRALHDHPSWNISYLLKGEYTEWTIAQGGVHHSKIYKAGNLRFRLARTAHRIELHSGPCWSLFINGPKWRNWGFHCPKGWRPWQEFVDVNDRGAVGPGCN